MMGVRSFLWVWVQAGVSAAYRAARRTLYGIRLDEYGADTVTATLETVPVSFELKPLRYGTGDGTAINGSVRY